MDQPNLFLGVDCGGTKTEAVITDAAGKILGKGYAGSANIHNLSLTQAFEHIQSAIIAAGNGNIGSFDRSCLGIAGLDTDTDKQAVISMLTDSSPFEWANSSGEIIICNDGLIGLKSGTDANKGICLVSSTGSNCYGIDDQGHEHRAGDWGYLVGDQGSGFTIGLKLIRLCLKEFDGRRPTTSLTPKLLSYLNLRNPTDLLTWIYRDSLPIKQIASLTKLLNDADLITSPAIQEIVTDTIRELMLAYSTVVKKLRFDQTDFPVVLVGGVFQLASLISDPVTQAIRSLTPQAEINLSSTEPVMGALKIAREEHTLSYFLNLGIFSHQHRSGKITILG